MLRNCLAVAYSFGFELMEKGKDFTSTLVTKAHLVNIIKILCNKLKWLEEQDETQDLANEFNEGKKPFKCKICDYSSLQKGKLNQHISTIHGTNEKKTMKPLKIGSLNIGRGLYKKEELLKNTILEHDFDVCSVSEVDIENFDEKKPFSILGYKTFFPLERPGTTTKRLICFIKESIEVTKRDDLMSELFSSVWLQIK